MFNTNWFKSIRTVLLFVSIAAFVPRFSARAESVDQVGPISAEIAGLKDQLEKGLKARRPVEFAFIGTVVTMVDSKQLSTELVLGTFHWARKKTKYKEYAYPYFEWGLRERAAKLGIAIP